MKNFWSIASVAFAGCIGFALLPSLQADTWNKKTNLTITEPLQVPSCCTPNHTVTLPPGEYVMVLLDSLSDRHIVRIFDKNQETVMTTILAIPNYRLKPTGKTVFQFWEVPAGQPRALRAWFYPGDNFGQEFAYPKQTAAQIAAFVKTPVPAIEAETSVVDDLKTAPLVAVDESGKSSVMVAELPMQTPPDAYVQPTSEVQPQTATADATESASAPMETLPATASGMPLIGWLGLVSMLLFAALGIRPAAGQAVLQRTSSEGRRTKS